MSVGSRIKALRKALDLTQQQFADRLGIARGIVGKYEVDVSSPSDAVISLICREFSVREAWLRTGEGEMFARRARADELGALVSSLLADKPESFRSRFITALLRFDPGGREWQILEDIYNAVAQSLPDETAE